MAITFKFYHDAALTQEVTALNPIAATQDTANSLGPVDVQLWFGSVTASVKVQATSDPGVDQISITPTDSAGGSGEPATALKLATSQAGLTGATAGAALSAGVTINSGTSNAFAFWVRIDDATAAVGAYTDLSLDTNDLTESAA
jgi:hypothetical protein